MSNARNIANLPNGDDAPVYACRAWVNFDGTNAFSPNPSTSAISDFGNVSSIYQNESGDYTVNFADEMPTADYSVSLSTNGASSDSHNTYAAYLYDDSSRSTSGVRIVTTSSGGSHLNNLVITVAVFC